MMKKNIIGSICYDDGCYACRIFGCSSLTKTKNGERDTRHRNRKIFAKRFWTKGTLVLGLDDSFPPMGFRDENNNIVGFDIDVATEVANRMGVELKLQPIEWSQKKWSLTQALWTACGTDCPSTMKKTSNGSFKNLI